MGHAEHVLQYYGGPILNTCLSFWRLLQDTLCHTLLRHHASRSPNCIGGRDGYCTFGGGRVGPVAGSDTVLQ